MKTGRVIKETKVNLLLFEKAVCLTLDKNYDNVTIDKELYQYGVEVERLVVGNDLGDLYVYFHVDEQVPGRQQAYNYKRCLDKAIRAAKISGISRLLWLEDDAVLTEKFPKIYPKLLNVFNTSLVDFDLFMLGGNHVNGPIQKEVNGHIIRPSYSLDYHAVVFNWTIYDLILSIEPSAARTFDGIVADMQQKGIVKVLACHPSIITQKDGWSDNENRYVSRSINHWL